MLGQHTQDRRIDTPAPAPHRFLDQVHGQKLGDCRARGLEQVAILERQSVSIHPALLGLSLRLLRRLDRIDDDVPDPELLDARQDLAPGPGADRQHRDHRADAEDHAQHG